MHSEEPFTFAIFGIMRSHHFASGKTEKGKVLQLYDQHHLRHPAMALKALRAFRPLTYMTSYLANLYHPDFY